MRRSRPADDSTQTPPGDEPAGAVQDALFAGALSLWQPAKGYRVNVDTLLLAAFAARCRPAARRVVDLGAGVGALALAYGHLGRVGRADLVERETDLVLLAERNLSNAGMAGNAHVADLARTGLPAALAGVADVVISNPPFFARVRGGAPAPDPVRSRSRAGPLPPFLSAARAAMGRRAYAFFVYPADALPELLAAAHTVGLVAKRLRLVHAFAASPARLALLELRQAKPGALVVEPPLVEWIARGRRSTEVDALVGAPRRPPA